jgi:hypothetical protein
MRGVDMTWAGGEHRFLLTIEHLRALQERCDAGPAYILERLTMGRWLVDDVIMPIRLGLEGGGMDKETARKQVKRHVEDEPLTLSVMTARVILAGALFGSEDDPVGESAAGEAAKSATLSREASGASPASTDGPASSTPTSAG